LEFVESGIVGVGDEGVDLISSGREGEESKRDSFVDEELVTFFETVVDDGVGGG
jgi:hypothetical protein